MCARSSLSASGKPGPCAASQRLRVSTGRALGCTKLSISLLPVCLTCCLVGQPWRENQSADALVGAPRRRAGPAAAGLRWGLCRCVLFPAQQTGASANPSFRRIAPSPSSWLPLQLLACKSLRRRAPAYVPHHRSLHRPLPRKPSSTTPSYGGFPARSPRELCTGTCARAARTRTAADDLDSVSCVLACYGRVHLHIRGVSGARGQQSGRTMSPSSPEEEEEDAMAAKTCADGEGSRAVMRVLGLSIGFCVG